MTERTLNLGTVSYNNNGQAHSQSGTTTTTYNYPTVWEHPSKYGELEKYLKKTLGDDAKRVASLFEDNAISLEDHLASAYLSSNGGTVYGNVVFAKNVDVYGTLSTKGYPISSYIPPVATIIPYAANFQPNDVWLFCDGTAYSTTTYADLYGAIGSTYDTSNGQTSPGAGYFRVPDLRGVTLVGLNPSDSDFDTRGKSGGAKTVALTTSEMPAHTHTQIAKYQGGTTTGAHVNLDTTINNNDYGYAQTGSTGSGAAHQNMPPYVVIRYLIKAF